jgi:hypothetical protein
MEGSYPAEFHDAYGRQRESLQRSDTFTFTKPVGHAEYRSVAFSERNSFCGSVSNSESDANSEPDTFTEHDAVAKPERITDGRSVAKSVGYTEPDTFTQCDTIT